VPPFLPNWDQAQFHSPYTKRFNEFNLFRDVGCIENEMKAVRCQKSFKLAMPGVTYAKEAANFRWARM
jgi:hypothetical protein